MKSLIASIKYEQPAPDQSRPLKYQSRFRYVACALFLAGASLTGSPANASNIIVDGSFEQPQTGPGGTDSGYMDFKKGDLIGGAWRVVGSDSPGAVSVYPNTEKLFGTVSYNVVDGTQALDLTGDFDNGAALGVEQAVSTVPGQQYLLTFFVGSTVGQDAIVKVAVNGQGLLTASNANLTAGATNWEEFSQLFTASSAVTTVDFINGSQAGVQTVGLDGVAMAATPEPASCALIGAGLLALGLWRRKAVLSDGHEPAL